MGRFRLSLLLHGGGESSIVRRSRKYIVITERKSNFLRSSWSFIWQSVNERLNLQQQKHPIKLFVTSFYQIKKLTCIFIV